jgi:heme/copper-type cytochrome/quinol oxidase subunit 3
MTMTATAPLTDESSRDIARLPVGRVGMWWFLASEIMVFGGLMGTYVLSRIAAGGWGLERAHVNTRLAALNTLVLITSSLSAVQAHAAAERDDAGATRRYLLLTVLLGCTFLGIKAYEYWGELAHGFTPATNLFWSFYYTMTGLHGLHVVAGIIANLSLALAVGGRWPTIRHRVEFVGLYWHFVDVVWIFLFPLLYLS